VYGGARSRVVCAGRGSTHLCRPFLPGGRRRATLTSLTYGLQNRRYWTRGAATSSPGK
jgi:hypothetical protein